MNEGHQRFRQTPACMNIHNWLPCAIDHDPLHHSREEEEGEGDANHGVNDTECLPTIRERGGVTISCELKEWGKIHIKYIYFMKLFLLWDLLIHEHIVFSSLKTKPYCPAALARHRLTNRLSLILDYQWINHSGQLCNLIFVWVSLK